MRKSFATRLLTGTGLALLLAATLAGCSSSPVPDKVLTAGAGKVLDGIMPTQYSTLLVSRDACALFLKPPSLLDQVWVLFLWVPKSSNVRMEDLNGKNSWELNAHRENAHWVVDDFSLDPEATSPADVAKVIDICLAAAAKEDQEAAEEADAAKKSANTVAAAWLAVASGTDPVVPQTMEH